MSQGERIGPRRIVCLTDETTETLYLLGEQERIVGISGFTVRPAQARREKPKVAGFTSAKIERIVELITIAGGEDCFPELSIRHSAKERIIADPIEVVRRSPEVLIASWCGKKFSQQKVLERVDWESIPALQHRRLFEIKSCDILQPGPAALTDGRRQLQEIVGSCAQEPLP